jgi:hypothetical protein
MSDEPDNRDEPRDQGDDEPATLAEAQETIRALRKDLTATRKESARRRQALKERGDREADAGIWKTVALEAVVQAEAAAAGARRPELLGRLVDANAIDGETLDEIRTTVREQISETLDANPELRADPAVVGALSPGPRDRFRREQRRADPDAWLRKAARQ